MVEITGDCTGLIAVTLIGEELALEQPFPFITLTVNTSVDLILTEGVVAPLLQTLPLASEEVSVTLSPKQKVVAPFAVTNGVDGKVSTSIVLVADGKLEQVPLLVSTLNTPASFTTMFCVVAPLLHKLPVAAEEVKVTLSPAQNLVTPEAVIVGVLGNGLTVTIVAIEAGEVQLPFATLTV